MTKEYGLAGKLASSFVNSKITPLMIVMSILLGIAALQSTPREEEPQILVPMIDIMVPWPGHSASEVARLLTAPLEDYLMDLAGLEYLYSISSEDGVLLIARFNVGYDTEDALILIRQAYDEVRSQLPMGVLEPQVASKSIDDVPIFALTLYGDGGEELDPLLLSDLGEEIAADFRKEPNVSDVVLIGEQDLEWFIELKPDTMARYGLSASMLASQLRPALSEVPLTQITRQGTSNWRQESLRLEGAVKDLDALRAFSIQTPDGQSLFLSDVATVTQRLKPLDQAVWYWDHATQELREGITLAVSKRPGTNASTLTHRLQERLEVLENHGLFPEGTHYQVVRDYGHTAKEKSDELIKHLLIATLSVALLIALALGFRESLVVLLAVPVTLALTLLLAYLFGFTINRVTLFALIFSIGILVDDAIVVVENIHRHAVMKDGRTWLKKILDAVNEVGNPTILATFTVIAAILPMAYVGGLMGPYMLPIPILASTAMLFSLIIAFVISPWAATRLMKEEGHKHGPKEDLLSRIYRRLMTGLLRKRWQYWGFLFLTGVLFLAAASLVLLRLVEVKMLPFDNKSEVQIVLDMPEGTLLEDTAKVAFALNQAIAQHEDVDHTQIYVGTASPYTFNGLVRHYYLRSAPHEGEIAVTLRDRHERSKKSHGIAKEIRNMVAGIGDDHGASVKVVEIPPGPPVLSTLVAEVYGPHLAQQRALAEAVAETMRGTDGVVDVDTYESDAQNKTLFAPDQAALHRYGVSAAALQGELHTLAYGTLGFAPVQERHKPIMVRLGMDRPLARDVDQWRLLPIAGTQGAVPLGALIDQIQLPQEGPVYHKNGQRVVYVLAEVAGAIEAPVYALAKLQGEIVEKAKAMGVSELPILHTSMPGNGEQMMMKWDGEWHITVEVFRDMGIAFAAVVVLIYLLVVGWFRSFLLPLVILSPIPLSLVGILPGHWMFGAFFTATSMIGFIAGAGIIVRNSIILVDFIELKRREGMGLEEAVIEAGIIRFRPMLLTASAVVVGAAVILFDPIFQGLAISLMMGEVAATLLSRMAVPLLYAGLARIQNRHL